MNGRAWIVIGTAVTLALGGCQKAAERSMEEMAEDALRESGATDADVDFSEGRVSITAQDESGKTTVQMAGDRAIDLPAGFPADVPVFPGSTIGMSVSAEDEGLSTTLISQDAPASIHAYYLDNLRKNGWTIDQEIKVPPVWIVHGTKNDREVAVSISGEGRESSIVIVVTGG